MRITEKRHSFTYRKARSAEFWVVECMDDNHRDPSYKVLMGIVGDETAAQVICDKLNHAAELIRDADQIRFDYPYRSRMVQ